MATMIDKLNVLIIGAGRIGAFFDKPGSKHVLTHAHAFSMHPGFTLLGFHDTDRRKASKAASVWGGQAAEIDQFFEERVDVVSIAVPDAYHYPLLRKIAAYPVGIVFLEKPVATTMGHARKIAETYRKKKVPVCLNYRRRFVPDFQAIRAAIGSGRYGDFVGGTGYYGKGLLHNGSHMIDLLRFLVAEPRSFTVIDHSLDYSRDDPSVSVVLRMDGGQNFVMRHIDHRLYTLFEMDLFFERARLRIVDSGFTVEMHEIKKDRIFSGYRNMEKTRESGTSLKNALYYAAENIYRHMRNGVPLACTLHDGLQDMALCSRIITAVKKNEKKNIIVFP
jgi:predicted dehydrogenase